MWPAGSTGHPAPPSGCPSSQGPGGVKTAPKRQQFSDIGADSDRELPLKNSGRCRGANGVTRGRAPRPPQGRAYTSSTGSPKTPCERSSSYAPPAHEILPLQMPGYAIGPRHCVLRLPPVDRLMCCSVRPVSRTSDASDASSRHAFTPGSVSLAASAAVAVLGTRPAA
eukprot:COSAG06_NODE_3238_length_5631_cov_20.701193_4_plen_168_part_00